MTADGTGLDQTGRGRNRYLHAVTMISTSTSGAAISD